MTGRRNAPRASQEVAPDPAALIESMRAFGYSLPSAVADLIDNSISAGARTVDLAFEWRGSETLIAVSDDGCGMDERGLVEAMRLGSRSPTETRAADDLGRFGLGLKSAGWSQARVLTVITRASHGPVVQRTWDLDHVVAAGKWSLLETTPADALGYADELARRPHGTTVILTRADKLIGLNVAPDDNAGREQFLSNVRRTEHHLAMVFHRFLTGPKPLTLRIAGRTIRAWDPFLERHAATQRLPTEDLPLAGRRVHVAPYVLPHVSKLTSDEHAAAGGADGWNAHQGFYVYRARRLLVAGSWLGLRRMQQEEHYKLARIRVDLDNSLDLLWQIDVRKASATIPASLVVPLRVIATVTRRRAAEAYRFRGKQVARSAERNAALSFVWQTRALRGGARSFALNRRHPLIAELLGRDRNVSRGVETALRLAEENLPIESIAIELGEHRDEPRPGPYDGGEAEVVEMLRVAVAAAVSRGAQPEDALRALSVIEPFDSHPAVVQTLLEEELGERHA